VHDDESEARQNLRQERAGHLRRSWSHRVSHPDRDQAERRDEEGRGIEEQHVLDADMRNRDPTDRRHQQHPEVGCALDRRHSPRVAIGAN